MVSNKNDAVSSAQPSDFTPERYEHQPSHDHTSIRLLTLLPDEFDAPLRCYITECEQLLETEHEALFYTWGDPVFPQVIYISDQPV